MKKFIFIIMIIACHDAVKAQKDELQLIRASQAGASPLFFDIGKDKAIIPVSNFYNDKECIVRNGLADFHSKVQKGQDVTVAFLGGSITQAEYGYRMQTAAYLQSLFPRVKFKWINAGIAGTGADLGACRLNEHVLQFNPDLVFIEFAVNGAFADGIEGIIGQVIQRDPGTAICLLYTITASQVSMYEKGHAPDNIKILEKIADHYSIPSVHLSLEAISLKKEGQLSWSPSSTEIEKIQFSTDGVHPTQAGGNIYASALARALIKLFDHRSLRYEFKAPLFSDQWVNAGMYDPLKFARFDGKWESIETSKVVKLEQFSHWFPRIICSGEPGSSFGFKFKGSMFGLFDIGGPEAGQLEIWLDGKPFSVVALSGGGYNYFFENNEDSVVRLVDRFNKYCNNRYRGQAFFVEIPEGIHTVQFIISPLKSEKKMILGKTQLEDITANPDKYNQTDLFLGKIILRGEAVDF